MRTTTYMRYMRYVRMARMREFMLCVWSMRAKSCGMRGLLYLRAAHRACVEKTKRKGKIFHKAKSKDDEACVSVGCPCGPLLCMYVLLSSGNILLTTFFIIQKIKTLAKVFLYTFLCHSIDDILQSIIINNCTFSIWQNWCYRRICGTILEHYKGIIFIWFN